MGTPVKQSIRLIIFGLRNFAKKKKAKKLKKITPEQVDNAEKRLRQLLGGKDHRSTSTYAFAKKPRQYN